MAMTYEDIMQQAELSQKKIRKEESSKKLISLDVGASKKLPKKSVDPEAIKRLLGETEEKKKKAALENERARLEGARRTKEVLAQQAIARKRKGRHEREEQARAERKLKGNRYDEAHKAWNGKGFNATEAYTSKEAATQHADFMKQVKRKQIDERKPIRDVVKDSQVAKRVAKPEPDSVKPKPSGPLRYDELMALAAKQETKNPEINQNVEKISDEPLSAKEKEERDRLNSKSYKRFIKTGVGSKSHAANGDQIEKEKSVKGFGNEKSAKKVSSKAESRHVTDTNKSQAARSAADSDKTVKKSIKTNTIRDVRGENRRSENSLRDSGYESNSATKRRRTEQSNEVSKTSEARSVKPSKATKAEPEQGGSTWDRIYNRYHQEPDSRSASRKRSRVIDSESESEYDSEMDDFIDDDMPEEEDYRLQIRQMFGYNPHKYRHLDDEDDSSMVASFSEQQKEEKRSARAGLQEDLEDIRQEEQRQKMKRLKKQKARRL